MRSPAAPPQPRFVPPSVVGTEPGSVSGDFQSRCATPVVASPVQISQGLGRGGSKESGAPPAPGSLTNATRRPSGDQRGDRSRENDGARNAIAVLSFVYTPMKAWSPRFATNASREPSGDQRGSPLSPRTENSCLAGADPSIGAVQIWPPLTNATRSLRGETTGSS